MQRHQEEALDSQPGGGRGWTEQCCGVGGGEAWELSISGCLEVVVPFLFP